MNPKTRSSIMTGPNGSLDVAAFVKDYKDAAAKMKDRFKPEYAAETEVVAFLKMSRTIDAAVKPEAQSADEWAALRTSIVRLSGMYHIDFKSDPAGWVAHHSLDMQVKASVEKLAKNAEAFSKSYKDGMKADKALDPAKRKQAETAADGLQKAAGELKSQFNGSNVPATQLEALMKAAQGFSSMPAVPVSGPAQADWQTFHGNLAEVAGMFGMPSPR
jgi:hypothetical protein